VTRPPRQRSALPEVGRPGGRDALLLAIALTAVSTSGPLMAATVVPALAIAFWRNALASALLWPVALVRCRDELRSLDGHELRLTLLAGLLLALHFGTWVPSLTFTSVASATALVATQPVWTALLSGLRGAPVGARVWVGTALATAGALLLTGVDLQTDTRALVGDGLALAGGLFAAGYVVVGGEVRRSVSTTTYTTLCYSTAAALLLVVCVVGRQPLSGYAGVDWLKLAGITLGAQLLGHSLFNVVLRRVSPTVVSLAVLLEIPGAALIAAVFLGQVPPLLALPAAVLLLAGLGVVVGSASRRTEPAVPVE
jgi:drug/metabolite transporter (DMT)-like permease